MSGGSSSKIALAFILAAAIGAVVGAAFSIPFLNAAFGGHDIVYRSPDLLSYYQSIFAKVFAIIGGLLGIGVLGIHLLIRK